MKNISILLLFLFITQFSLAQISDKTNVEKLNLNKQERVEWFKNLGFGMFIHFSFDSQLGVVISHSMAGASDDYLNRFVNDLPKTFNPKDFDAVEIATLAKLAGMKYIVSCLEHNAKALISIFILVQQKIEGDAG